MANQKINESLIEKLIFNGFSKNLRYTQDSPIYPDVWREYFNQIKKLSTYRVDLILTPYKNASINELYDVITKKLSDSKNKTSIELATNGDTLAVKLTFEELVLEVLPLTSWYQKILADKKENGDLIWLKQLVGAFLSYKEEILESKNEGLLNFFIASYNKKYSKKSVTKNNNEVSLIWSISRNRPAIVCVEKSVPVTKADAVRRIFEIDGSDINWAVLDTGIDATHDGFRKKMPRNGEFYNNAFGNEDDREPNNTRVVATYDFTKFRDVLSNLNSNLLQRDEEKAILNTKVTSNKKNQRLNSVEILTTLSAIEQDLKNGRMLDWSLIAPLLRIPHNSNDYVAPKHPHGTHVAGIIGAGKSLTNKYCVGMCPNINLYDIRVLDERGEGNEFNILAAIQFLRWMNTQKEGTVIHGANLSFSMFHEVKSYGCGQTPVCEACDRLVSEGVVVVAAAGNSGLAMFQNTSGSIEEGFRTVNITDPGNADLVITVGSTHRNRPHAYGVSYFSSKGPTGDGRIKPDLIAPGEKIESTVIGNATDKMDGTSMSAPHVSGAAALLLAKNRELIGRPRKIKEVLCKTATDLGREKYFQGAGLLDVLRAIQSI